MKYDSYSSDVGIQEFYKLFKYVSSKSAKVLLPGNLDIINTGCFYKLSQINLV